GGPKKVEPPTADAGEPKKVEPPAKKVDGAAKETRFHCILLWMSGGPSQLDTFDLKPGTGAGGPVRAIPTVTKGLTISQHLPRLAKLTNHLALLRTVSHREGDHARATHLMRIGRPPGARTAF